MSTLIAQPTNRAGAEAAQRALTSGKGMTVVDKEETFELEPPPPPFTTATLIQAANTELGWTAAQTMRVAQRLFEGVVVNGVRRGLITYPRTASENVSEAARRAAKGLQRAASALSGQNTRAAAPRPPSGPAGGLGGVVRAVLDGVRQAAEAALALAKRLWDGLRELWDVWTGQAPPANGGWLAWLGWLWDGVRGFFGAVGRAVVGVTQAVAAAVWPPIPWRPSWVPARSVKPASGSRSAASDVAVAPTRPSVTPGLAHEAIRPAQLRFIPDQLTSIPPDELALYRLIWQRFLDSQAQPKRVRVTRLVLETDDDEEEPSPVWATAPARGTTTEPYLVDF